MRLVELTVHNYKSLRAVTVRPEPLSVFVGPNAAGKSNFCFALDFIGEMYRWGIELAVARHGGYENICYRHTRRSKSPISFHIRARFDEPAEVFPESQRHAHPQRESIEIEHVIAFGTSSQKIQAPFRIVNEAITISRLEGGKTERKRTLGRWVREKEQIVEADIRPTLEGRQVRLAPLSRPGPSGLLERERERLGRALTSTQSILPLLDRWFFIRPSFTAGLGSIRVFQLSPTQCRQAGVPTPQPELERSGVNLPAVIEFIRAHRPQQYQSLLATLKRVMPTLEDLDVSLTPNKTLGLSFKENGFGRPWTSEDISDGTIRALALLAALFDPGVEVVVIEEPENSLHPWAIRQFVDACRVASQTKQVILTTHSPVLINHLTPSEAWIVQRPEAETRIDPLVSLDPEVEAKWEKGEYTLAEYLDSGAIPAAVPSEPL